MPTQVTADQNQLATDQQALTTSFTYQLDIQLATDHGEAR